MACGKKCFLSVLSVVIIGLTMLLLIAASISAKSTAVSKYDQKIFAVLVTFSIVSAGVLAFSLYAAICGKSCAKVVLSILFIIYDIFILIIGISLLASKSTYMHSFEDVFKEAGKIYEQFKKKEDIERDYDCCGYDINDSYGEDCPNSSLPCKPFIEKEINTFMFVVGILALLLFILLTVGIVLSFVEAYNIKAADEIEEEIRFEQSNRFMRPMAYGF